MEYKIRRYTPDLKEKVAQLQSHLWGFDDQMVSSYFHWKYKENPYFSEPIIIVAMHYREVVGMIGFYGSEWEYGQPPKRVLIPCAADLVIAPGHRNRGLFTRIMEAAEDELSRAGFSHIFNLSPTTAVIVLSLTMGWHRLGPMKMMRWSPPIPQAPLMALIHRNLKRIARRFPISYSYNSGAFSRLDKYRNSLGSACSRCLIIEKSPRIMEMTELIKRIGHRGRLRHVRDPRFFHWKFNNPMIVNRFLYYYVNKVLQGYLVLQVPKHGDSRTTKIMDWEATDLQVGGELLKVAIDFGKFPGINI
jgi:GNAT superfamily N-acetyltransferase